MSISLEGDTLGEKHKHFNKLVRDAIANEVKHLNNFNPENGDVDNLIKIDIASHNRDVTYILDVLQSEDLLYVSRTINRCSWLITDRHFEHIINPEYLYSNLFPQMTYKARLKLLKHIKCKLKDEFRVQMFYEWFEKENVLEALKWLPNCSLEFILDKVKIHASLIKVKLLKRLCKKSSTVLEVFVKNYDCSSYKQLEATVFLLKTYTDKYLDLVENTKHLYSRKLSKRATEFIMTKCPEKVIDNFEFYSRIVHVPTFAVKLRKRDIKQFLITLKDRVNFKFNEFKYFIESIPDEERFEFVKEHFINDVKDEKEFQLRDNVYFLERRRRVIIENYVWYQFAPFDTAFTELKKLMSTSNKNKKSDIFKILILCTKGDLLHINQLLTYFNENHKNDAPHFKFTFLNNLLTITEPQIYDYNIWKIIKIMFNSFDLHSEPENEIQNCIISIIIFKILYNEEIPEMIEKEFKFNTLKSQTKKFNQESKDKVFIYLYTYISTKLSSLKIKKESQFAKAVEIMNEILNLLVDWKKELLDYPFVIDKIKELVILKKDNLWTTNISTLYNKKKQWRKYFYDESLILNPSEDVCLNTLKHGPEILDRYKSVMDSMNCNKSLPLTRLHKKVHIYFPQTIADTWIKTYFDRLNNLSEHEAIMRGLCVLLPRQELYNIICKYTPENSKISWEDTDKNVISLQKHLAKNMHRGRPQPSPENIMRYAKGDYLQFALPSLLAIFYNLNYVHSCDNIPKLLNAPVSLQKHGIRFAFTKLKSENLKQVFFNTWKSTKNATIRSVIFKLSIELLRKEKDPAKIYGIWELLEIFIENLSYEEDKIIYEYLYEIETVPQSIRPKFLMKSYKFLKTLIVNIADDNGQFKSAVRTLEEYTKEIMEELDSDFVANIILEYISTKLDNDLCNIDEIVPVMTSYLLCAKSEDIQTQKFEKVMIPALDSFFASWDKKQNNKLFVKAKLQNLLNQMCRGMHENIVNKNMIMPVKLFSDIQTVIIEKLLISDDYVLLRQWDLTVELLKLLQINEETKDWAGTFINAMPEFAKICKLRLKDDMSLHFPGIYVLFTRALLVVIESLIPNNIKWNLYEHLLKNEDFIPVFLSVIRLIPTHNQNEEDDVKKEEMLKIILAQSSLEVKMHYYHRFSITTVG